MTAYTFDIATGQGDAAPLTADQQAELDAAASAAQAVFQARQAAFGEAAATLKADAASNPVSAALVTLLGL